MRRSSINRRLSAGLSLVAAIGATILLVLVFIEYRLGIDTLAGDDASRFALSEVSDHVGLPLLLLTVPALLAGQFVIQRSFRALQQSADVIRHTPAVRGVRVDDAPMPEEVMPFVDAINGLLSRLDAAAREHEAFAADVAHQIRTPLAIMSLALEETSPDTAALREEVSRMRRLVEQLLLLTQANAQAAVPSRMQPSTLVELATETASGFAPLALRLGRTIAFEDSGGSGTIAGHREALSSALRNLLDNALRFTPEGGVITVGAGPGNRLFVRDEGQGLAPARLAAIMRRKGRADEEQRAESTGGAGLGLAIVARIMAAHGGRLETVPERCELAMVFPEPSQGTIPG